MTKKYCAFLRGVNVNGINIKTEELKNVFLAMGFCDAKTILATGNVIFTSDRDISRHELKVQIEDGLSKQFHYDAHIFLHDPEEIRAILTEAQTILVPEGCHHYSLIFDDAELSGKLTELFQTVSHMEREQLLVHPYGAFWIVPKGSTLDSAFGSKVLGSKQYKSLLTSRNINTIEKISRALSQ